MNRKSKWQEHIICLHKLSDTLQFFMLFTNAFQKSLPYCVKLYLNNLIEQDHRFIKKRTKPMLGFKSFRSAKITIAGIENIRMIQKGQIVGANDHVSTFENFKMLMVA